jgi:3-deoxy-D-manno-octulosonic-acid transferase
MMEAVAGGTYRAAMAVGAGVAGAVARVPGVPGRWRAVGDRLGRLGATERAMAAGAPAIWLHAASVGELMAARSLLARMRDRFPGRIYVASTLTRTGLALAQSLPEVHLAFLFPLDAPAAVARLLGALRLEAFLFTETEIWPTFLTAADAAGVPLVMVSGRVSARTAGRTRWLRPLYRPALARVTCCMQTEDDARRIVALGADPRRVQVTGSLKFEAPPAAMPPEVERVGAALGRRPLVVAGSTHDGEEAALLAAGARLRERHPDLGLLLAPRHPERLDAVAGLVTAAGWPLVRFSQLAAGTARVEPEGPVAVLLDVVGPLAHCYALGRVAFVGGSLVPVGGHNVLEPARASRAIVVGPHTEHAAEVVDRLAAAGGLVRVAAADRLAAALGGLLEDPERAAEIGRRARSLADSGRGATERHLKVIAAVLSSARFARAAPEE